MGIAGVSAPIPPKENQKLKRKWENSDIHLIVDEQKPSISPNIFKNFCPEVINDRFGWFACLLQSFSHESEKKLMHARLRKGNITKNDWRWTWAKVIPLHFTDCSLYSLLIHQNGFSAFYKNPGESDQEDDNELTGDSFAHSPDFRCVSLQGHNFTLTHKQSHVIEILYQAHNCGTPEVGGAYILEELGTPSSRLSDTFRSSKEAWRTLIAKGRKKGTLRLNI